MHFQSHIPLVYWGDCILTSTYLINRILSPLISHKTPFELLIHKRPSYSHLHAFERLYCGSILAKTWSKSSLRTILVVFLSYPPGYKGYKLLDLVTNFVFISRDVVFHESNFLFKTSSNVQPNMDIFVDTMFHIPFSGTSHPPIFGSSDPTSSLTPTSSSSHPLGS